MFFPTKRLGFIGNGSEQAVNDYFWIVDNAPRPRPNPYDLRYRGLLSQSTEVAELEEYILLIFI